MKKLSRILCLIIALVVMCSTFVAADINPQFYENAVQQSLDAYQNATTANDKVFYLITAIYDYCYTQDPGRAVDLLEEVKAAVLSEPENIEKNAKLAADMTDSAGKLLLKKEEYSAGVKMYKAAIDFYNQCGGDQEAIAACEEGLAKCQAGARVDRILLICIPVFVIIVIIMFAVVSKRTKNSGASKVVHKKKQE